MIREELIREAVSKKGRQSSRVYVDRKLGTFSLERTLDRTPDSQVDHMPVFESVLSRFKSPRDPTPVTRLGRDFERIRIYREFNTGPLAPARTGASPAARKDFLSDGGDNLAVVLTEMEYNGSKPRVDWYLNRLWEGFQRVGIQLEGGTARVYVHEQHLSKPTPAYRLSDGTLKFLCLLTVLLNPEPSSLICIEEPEAGLHPDALRLMAEAMVEASERVQLVVTTHSESLVSALSSRPEAVVVCDRDFDNATEVPPGRSAHRLHLLDGADHGVLVPG